MFDWNTNCTIKTGRETTRNNLENLDAGLPTYKSTIIPTINDNQDRERIYRLKDRVSNVQKKLENMEKTEKTAQKLYSLLDDMESPIKPPFNQGSKLNTLNFSQNKPAFSDNDLTLIQKQNLTTYRQFTSLNSINENISTINPLDLQDNLNDMKGINIFVNNQKTKSLKDILIKMDKFKSNAPPSNKILNYCQNKIENNKPFYYDFVKENDHVNLKVFTQILYEEIENLANLAESNKNILETCENKIDEKQMLCDKFAEEKIDQNTIIQGLNKSIAELDEKSNKYGLFFIEIRLLLQSIVEEFMKPNGSNNDNKQSLIQSIKMITNQISKFNSSSGYDTLSSITQIFDDHNRFNEYSNIMNLVGDDKNNLSNLNCSNIDVIVDKRNPKYNNDFVNKLIMLENENKKLRNQIEVIYKDKDKKNKSPVNQSFNQNYLVLLDELKRNTIEKDELERKLAEANEKLIKSDEQFNDIGNKLDEFEHIGIENEELKKKLDHINEEFGFIEQKFNNQINELSDQLNAFNLKYEKLFQDKSRLDKEYIQLTSEKKDISIKYEQIVQKSQTIDKIIQEKDHEINYLKQEKLSFENCTNQLRDHEKKYMHDIKHAGDIEVL